MDKPTTTPTGEASKPERMNGDGEPTFSKADVMQYTHPVEMAVTGKQLTPYQGEQWKAELRRLMKADKRLGVSDFDDQATSLDSLRRCER